MTVTVRLEPMTAEQYVSWFDELVRNFAQDKIDSGNWPEAGALERSARQNAELLPQGVDTAGHHLFLGDVDGTEIGHLWLHVDVHESASSREAFIYDIEVDEESRGKGFGRGLLEAGERWCADHDIATLRLHVFGFNTTAIRLYESAGFATTNLSMAKQIAPA